MYDFTEKCFWHLSTIIQTYIISVVIYLLDRLQVARLLAMVNAQSLVVTSSSTIRTTCDTSIDWTTSTYSTAATCTTTPTPTGIISNNLPILHLVGRWCANQCLMLIGKARLRHIFEIYVVFILVILHWIVESAAKICT